MFTIKDVSDKMDVSVPPSGSGLKAAFFHL